MELWELIAREQIRDTIVECAWDGDGGRFHELADRYTPAGELHIRGSEPIVGRTAILDFFLGGYGKASRGDRSSGRLVRHAVNDIRFVELTLDEAKVESYFLVLTEIGLDHHGRYRDVLVPDGAEWRFRRRQVSTEWRAPESTMAPPSAVLEP